MRADLGAGVHGAAVHSHPRPAGRAVGDDPAGVRPEPVGRILAGDAALQGGAPGGDAVLGQAQVRQRVPGGDADLAGDQVDVGDLLGDGVLHLDAWIHLDEVMRPVGTDQEFHRAGVHVTDLPGEGHGVGADGLPDRRIQAHRRGHFDHLLVPALHRAVPLVQVHGGAGGVGQHLDLDVPRIDHRALQEHRGVAEGGLGLSHGGADRLREVFGVIDPAHATSTAAGHGLDEDREPDLVGAGDELVDVGGRWGGLQHRQAGLAGGGDGPGLVAGQFQHLGRRSDEGDAGLGAGLGQVGVLGQEAVAGVDGVGAGLAGRRDDLVHVQVGAHRVPDLADLVGLIRLLPVRGVAVLVGVDGHRRHAQLVGGAEGADGDLAAIRDQDLGEHRARVSPVGGGGLVSWVGGGGVPAVS